MNQQGQAAAMFKEALMDHPDDWTSLQHYLDCMLTQTAEVAGEENGPQSAEGHDQVSHGLLPAQVPDEYLHS